MNNIFKIDRSSRIYVVCPANNKTGGTELLHQLANELAIKGLNAYVAYYLEGKCNRSEPTPEEFKKYKFNACLIDEVIDNKENIIVLPEVCIGKHRKYKNLQKCVWWLSVDNFKVMHGKFNRLKKYGLKSFIKHLFLMDYSKLNDITSINIHLYQSYFASNFLENVGISNDHMFYLSDYINDIYKNNFTSENKEDIVIYNPKKGLEFTQKLILFSKEIKWVPIINMSNEEVVELMKKAKVYIDFGNHPGKDRIPREAAISGCCVITNKSGSAAFAKDVPIPEAYKIEDKDENITKIIHIINNCIENYDLKIHEFDTYREFISKEKDCFSRDVEYLFQ